MKLPSFKISLPKIGPFGKSKKPAEDETPDEEDVDAAAEEGEAEAGGEAGEEGEGGDEAAPPAGLVARIGRKRLILIAAAAGILLLGGLGTTAWFVLSSSTGPEAKVVSSETQKAESKGAVPAALPGGAKQLVAPAPGPEGVPRVIALLPPKMGAAGLTPTGNDVAGAVRGETPEQGLLVSPATPASFAAIPELPVGEPLPPAPVEGLFEQGSHGMLPRIGNDGAQPWKVYARPHKAAADLPQVAVIVRGLGLSRPVTDAAVRKLPPQITLSFDPYAQGISDWVRFARERGHESLIMLPMEPREFPIFDPGPYALRTLAAPQDNIRLLEYMLGQAVGYIGVASTMGSKFSQNEEQLEPILSILKARGLMFVDGSMTDGSRAPAVAAKLSLPKAIVDMVLDRSLSRARVEAGLAEAEEVARNRVGAIVVIDPTPAAIEAVAVWAQTLEAKQLGLAPVSALAGRQLPK